jgi:hypothetical protein
MNKFSYYPFFQDVELVEYSEYGSKHALIHWDGGFEDSSGGVINLEKWTMEDIQQLELFISKIKRKESTSISIMTGDGPDTWIYDANNNTLQITQWDYGRMFSDHKQHVDQNMLLRMNQFIEKIKYVVNCIKNNIKIPNVGIIGI